MNEPKRFSALAFSEAARGRGMQTQVRVVRQELSHQEDSEFRRCVEEIRHFLASPKAGTEEEKLQYSDALNRAILGFEAERARFLAMINDYLAKQRVYDIRPAGEHFATLAEAIFAEVIGLNVLELLLKHKDGLEEIQVVGIRIFEVRSGRASLSPYSFRSLKEVERIQQNLVLFNSDTLSPRKKWAEVMLRDGSRVTMTGFGFTSEPTLTIRFYTKPYYTLAGLCHPDLGTIDDTMLILLQAFIAADVNMVIIGPTNSGKTSLMKALIGAMPDEERIVTIEGRLELMLKRDFPGKNVVEYEVSEDDPYHSARQAFKLALRQSPKRICHAEIRDDDANIYVRACTRGHEGSMTSLHAGELEDVPSAITDMCMLDGRGMNPERLLKRVTEYVTQVGLEMRVVHGRRKLVRIGELQFSGGEIVVRNLARYNEASDEWEYPDSLSERLSLKIHKTDPAGYRRLREKGVIA
ncbi:ATPase, T2SS/T4P/T4SS family [Paenibacillus sp. y28]|uniref:ATPase, T2SS/T4P/T4SS family n=1 Tax=Paenibacillus sp. y28 TaxID=3129110 RepID=UPI003017EA96